MRIRIAHETRYRYERPARSILQHLRLTPRGHDGQHVISWRIEPSAEGHLKPDEDGLGNVVHAFSADEAVGELVLRVTGEVETSDAAGMLSGAVERVPPAYFLRPTALTHADDEIRAMAEGVGRASDGALARLHGLLVAVNEGVSFEVSSTTSGTTAAQAFAQRRGVCQDLTHIFLAASRHLDIPARYVSGYFCRADGVVDQEAGHAWVEAHVPELGWIGFDPANGISTTDAHVRVAIGLDYHGAAPVRGSRRGGGSEALDVHITVQQAGRQSQS